MNLINKIKEFIYPKPQFEVVNPVDTNLWQAVRQNKLRQINELLIHNLIDINQPIIDVSNHTLLHEAILLNKREIFSLCLLHYADVNKADAFGNLPLHRAVILGRKKMVQELIKNGANPNQLDSNGKSCQDYALFYEQYDMIELLMQYSQPQRDIQNNETKK